MEARNPYAPPKAPLTTDGTPTALPSEPEVLEYGGFWRRLGAAILDAFILAPVGIVLAVLLNYTHRAFLYMALPSLLITLFYYVYLVRRFGGTPGKRILQMRIANLDGSPVSLTTALIRYSPYLLITLISDVANFVMTRNLEGIGFDEMTFLEKLTALGQHGPAWANHINYVMWAWYLGIVVSIIANAHKRALHDFIAGTVVLRDG